MDPIAFFNAFIDFYAWVALVTPRQPTSTVAPPMGANEAPKHPEKQAESARGAERNA